MRLALIFLASVALAQVQGLRPRTSATSYTAHASQDELSIGADVIDAEQVRNAFASRIYKGYVVVEVAVYPPAGKEVELSKMDFALHLKGHNSPIRPASARTIAAVLYPKPGRPQTPSAPDRACLPR